MRVLPAIVAALLLAASAAAPAALAQDVEFGTPTAEARLGEPIVFQTSLAAAAEPARVDLLFSAGDERAVTVLPAQISGGPGEWQATAILEGHTPPNTRIEYRFRARDVEGGTTVGPAAEVTVVDDRYDWQTLEGEVVRLHWHDGSEEFARRALEIGDDAIARASQLLGVAETEPVDFFVYATEEGLRLALGPGAREWVGGRALVETRTMLGQIEPAAVNSDWVDELVRHELTHLVFHTGTENPYRQPPSWLDEGVAVYLSIGYSAADRGRVERAAASGELMPLPALSAQFPTDFERALLAYAEGASAIDFFVTTHGEPTLWQLVRSYAEGVSDDEAFLAATGEDLAAFNEAWMASLGAEVPPPFGPQPAPPGPVPPGWEVEPGPSPDPAAPSPAAASPTVTSAAGASPAAPASPAPAGPLPGAGADERAIVLVGFAVVIAVLAVLLVALLLRARGARRPPPTSPWS